MSGYDFFTFDPVGQSIFHLPIYKLYILWKSGKFAQPSAQILLSAFFLILRHYLGQILQFLTELAKYYTLLTFPGYKLIIY